MNKRNPVSHEPPNERASKVVMGELVNEDEEIVRQRLQGLAWLLDQSIEIPGLGYRIGLDGFIGLIPGVGDLISAGVSTYLIAEASRIGASKPVLVRMAVNVLIDTMLGAVPVVGDLFDFAWKANTRNVKLLNKYLDNPRRVRRSSSWFVIALALALFAGVALILVAIGAAIVNIVQYVAS